jgi:methyl-accepting chemotaxis protein
MSSSVASRVSQSLSAVSQVSPDDGLDELAESRANTRAVIQVITAVGEKDTPGTVMMSTLDAVKAAFGYDYGACWVIDLEHQHTTFAMESGSLGPAYDRINQETHYKKGQGLTGKTWATADVLFIPVLRVVPNSALVDAACAAGVTSAVSFPFIVRGEVHGIFFFFSFRPISPSQDRLDALRNIGRLVGQAFSRLLDLERETENRKALQQNAEQILTVVQAAHSGNLTLTIPHTGNDAIGQVARGLEKFFADLRRSIRGIIQNAQALNTAAEELSLLSLRMQERSEDTAKTAAGVTGESKEVSANLESVEAGSRQMLVSINEIVASTSHASADVQSAVESATAARKEIGKLAASSTDIGGTIKVIESIARQTRLLALNASIEAARAGNAGLGFTVVANEVKQLASGTAEATTRISDKIEAIQQNTAGAVDSIGQIALLIERIHQMSASIEHTVEAQAATTRRIGENVSQAAAGSSSIVDKIASVAQIAKLAQEEAGQTQSAAKSVRALAAELHGLVRKFKV